MESKHNGHNSNSNAEESWTPQFFEEEMQLIQPNYDLVVNRYSIRPATLLNPILNDDTHIVDQNIIDCQQKSYNYDLPREDDDITREKETFRMMRNCGIESSLGGHLNSQQTLPTHQTKLKTIYEKNFPILLDEEFFKFKPTTDVYVSSSNSSNSSSSNSTTEKNSTLNIINSISLDSNNEENSEEQQSELDKVLRINRKTFNVPLELEEKYTVDFPDLNDSMKIKNTKRFCTPKKLYDSKKSLKST